MILFKIFFRRYYIVLALMLGLEFLSLYFLSNKFSFTLMLILTGIYADMVFSLSDKVRQYMLLASFMKKNALVCLLLSFFVSIVVLFIPYTVSVSSYVPLVFIDYLTLFLVFKFLLLHLKYLRYLITIIFFGLDYYLSLGLSSISQRDPVSCSVLLIAHSILLFLLLKRYKVSLWKYLI